MQAKNNTSPLSLPIQYAPAKVRAYGLKDAHSYPLVAMGKSRSGAHSASFRVEPDAAWGFPEIELRAGNSWPSIVLDVDGSNALYRIVDAVERDTILTPNWTVTRKGSGGTHAVWNLARPVHRGKAARKGPLKSLARVSEFYADALRADSGYNGVLSHNPMSAAHGPGFVTNWFHRSPYRLDELGEVIPLGWRKPTISVTAIGRNCSMFESLIAWAGKPENRENNVLAAAMAINEEIGRIHGKRPMDQPEVAAIARSVSGYRAKWIAKGEYYTQDQRSLWGKARGIRSGESRRNLTHDRDKAIIQAVSEGRTMRDVGMEYGLTGAAVYWILNRLV